MIPTLGDGDDIMIDRSVARQKLKDGIYVGAATTPCWSRG